MTKLRPEQRAHFWAAKAIHPKDIDKVCERMTDREISAPRGGLSLH
jgi:hypothetical protein